MAPVLPADFDFTVLDDPSFKEDAVREEIVAPILRALGYRPTGNVRVERSKALLHPFVMIGTKKHRVHIVPDYTLYSGARPILILDAKAPTEDITTSVHVEQVYSYAIHPEIRCEHFGLCNGRELVVFEIATLEPVLKIEARQFNARWREVEEALHYRFLEKPILRKFRPDFGSHARRTGVDLSDTALCNFHIDLISKLSDGPDSTYTAQCGVAIDGVDYLATFDFSAALLPNILACLPSSKLAEVEVALRRNPFAVFVGGKIKFDVGATFSPLIQGEHESFVPLLVTTILSATYQPDFVYPGEQTDVPNDHYRL